MTDVKSLRIRPRRGSDMDFIASQVWFCVWVPGERYGSCNRRHRKTKEQPYSNQASKSPFSPACPWLHDHHLPNGTSIRDHNLPDAGLLGNNYAKGCSKFCMVRFTRSGGGLSVLSWPSSGRNIVKKGERVLHYVTRSFTTRHPDMQLCWDARRLGSQEFRICDLGFRILRICSWLSVPNSKSAIRNPKFLRA